MVISPELAEHKAICHPSFWRALPSGPPAWEGGAHPRHYIRLRDQDIAELVATGGFSVPDDEVPDAVRAWRKTQEAVVEIVKAGTTGTLGILDATGKMIEEIGKVAING